MLRLHRAKRNRKRLRRNTVGPHPIAAKVTKYHGIVAAAAKLGVSRQHLYLVLDGKRHSTPLMARYNRLKEAR